jgi:hypothetical protein
MSDTSRREQDILNRARQRGGLAVVGSYMRLSGPGWSGSAFTLGAGSLAGSLFLGVVGGYTLLWVQPLAMLLGVVMLGAISYVALSLESSPFAAMRYRLNPVLAWSWLFGALGCNMIGAASSAVAANMCFLVPFSLLAKKWNRDFRGPALFDLATGTFIPFILATGAVVIAAASQFHTKLPAEAAVSEADVIAQRGDAIEKSLEPRRNAPGLAGVPVSEQERRVAFMLLRRDNSELAQSLRGLFGDSQMVQIVFGVGVLAMALSTISILMLVSGFAVCEAPRWNTKDLRCVWAHYARRWGCCGRSSGRANRKRTWPFRPLPSVLRCFPWPTLPSC